MVTTPTPKRVRLANDKVLLKKLVSLLEKEKLTKAELAEKLAIGDAKKINDSFLLAAVRLSGDSKFLENLIEKAGGRVKKNPQYGEKAGLKIQPWQFDGRGVADGQGYTVQFGRAGIITLRPTKEGDV